MTNMPCGPPKPRKAVCEVLCVRQMRPDEFGRGKQIGVVAMKHRAREHWLGKIQAPAAIGIKRDAHAFETPVLGEAGGITRKKRDAACR